MFDEPGGTPQEPKKQNQNEISTGGDTNISETDSTELLDQRGHKQIRIRNCLERKMFDRRRYGQIRIRNRNELTLTWKSPMKRW